MTDPTRDLDTPEKALSGLLSAGELRELAAIRALAMTDLAEAKARSARWCRASKRRTAIRRAVCNTVRDLHSHRDAPVKATR